MVNARPLESGFGVSEAPGRVTLTTASASAEVDLANGNVRFRDAAGNVVLSETGRAGSRPRDRRASSISPSANSSTAAPTKAFTASASTRTAR
jgi:predicted AlkP superfamily pyrophosphatase or phosphodiesterase